MTRGKWAQYGEGLFDYAGQMDPFRFEKAARSSGAGLVAGIDEAGRGPLAGPVVAAAVILPEGCIIEDLTDSKKLSPKQRDRLSKEIQEKALAWEVGISDAALVDQINILEATRRAMESAVARMALQPDYLLIDAVTIVTDIPQKGIVKGDMLSHSISAASVIAKVTRDRIMESCHQVY
ncbi:MAG: ribonuclease HII, partial [bacterium]|nr:ribonuclease HII [bacterium]